MADRFAPLEERRHGAPDTRDVKTERRHGAADTRKPEKLKRAVYRVNYFVGGQATIAFVCAFTDGEASAFMGVRDGSAQVNRVAYPVEIEGLDAAHEVLVPLPVFKGVPGPPSQLDAEELRKLRALIPPDKPKP